MSGSEEQMCVICFVDLVVRWSLMIVVSYESIKREIQTKPTHECRCDERLKTKAEESTRLAYTGFLGELEHLKIKTRLIDEMFPSVMVEYVFLK
jgi:hypothetical protein